MNPLGVLSGIWGKLAAAAAIVFGALAVIGRLKKAGRDEERVARQKADQVVRDRVDAVRPPQQGETVKALEEGRF